jgi:hypothetical protein
MGGYVLLEIPQAQTVSDAAADSQADSTMLILDAHNCGTNCPEASNTVLSNFLASLIGTTLNNAPAA